MLYTKPATLGRDSGTPGADERQWWFYFVLELSLQDNTDEEIDT